MWWREKQWLPRITQPLWHPGRLRLKHVCNKKQREDGFGEISSEIPGERVELRSGLTQELEESLAWSRLEPWRVSPPGEFPDREAAEGR